MYYVARLTVTFFHCTYVGIVKGLLIGAASSLAGDAVKFTVDSGKDRANGINVAESLSNAAYSAVWNAFPGRLIFDKAEDFIKNSGGMLGVICINAAC